MVLPRRFQVKGVFWRQFLRWAVLNIPLSIEPAVIAWWSLFFLLWGPGRRGVMQNLAAIKPGSWAITNFVRTLRVFWNYAWTITDNKRRARVYRITRTGAKHLSDERARWTSFSGGVARILRHA